MMLNVIECNYKVDARRMKLSVAKNRKARVDVHIRGRRIERLIDRKTGLRSGRNRIFPNGYSLASIWRSGRTEVLATFEAEMSWL
jgi:hypothetical protein